MFIIHITRCILEEGWGRESSTIKNNLLEVKINVIKCKGIGKAPSYLSFSPHQVNNLLVMGPEVEMLLRNIYPGRLSVFAQFKTSKRS